MVHSFDFEDHPRGRIVLNIFIRPPTSPVVPENALNAFIFRKILSMCVGDSVVLEGAAVYVYIRMRSSVALVILISTHILIVGAGRFMILNKFNIAFIGYITSYRVEQVIEFFHL